MKVNELTSYDPLLYLDRNRWEADWRRCYSRDRNSVVGRFASGIAILRVFRVVLRRLPVAGRRKRKSPGLRARLEKGSEVLHEASF